MRRAVEPSPLTFVLFPCLAILLGWGLRGFIGGGPYGAMIPGAMMGLCLGLLLDRPVPETALLSVFGAVGVGFGGEVTYGQTIGLLKHPETFSWGLLGLTVKGAVWGLLGGVVLGAGLEGGRIARRDHILAFLLAMPAFYIGWRLINLPQVIYFSDPLNEPREESWAGLLASALAFLAWYYLKRPKEGPFLPGRFALWGLVGGGLGFGGGALWMACGDALPVPQQWFGWWKMMEFTFGGLLGAAWGWCAWRNRAHIARHGDEALLPALPRVSLPRGIFFVSLILLLVYATPGLLVDVFSAVRDGGGPWAGAAHAAARMTDNFVVIGGLLAVTCLCAPALLWQAAVTITFCHVMIDLVDDLPPHFEAMPRAALFLAGVWAVALAVRGVARCADPRLGMFYLLTWVCVEVAAAKTFLHGEFLEEAAVHGWLRAAFSTMPAGMVVLGIFLASAVASSVLAARTMRMS